MRLLICLLMVTFFIAGNTVHAQTTRLSNPTQNRLNNSGTTSLRAGKAGMNTAAPQATEKVSETGVITKMVFDGPPTGWGVVKANTPCYSLEGKRAGNAPSGSVFTYSSVKNSSKNMVLEVKVEQDGAWQGPFFIDIADVIIFSGTPESMPKELLSDLKTYFSVTEKIAQRKQTLEEAEYTKNPHYESAKLTHEKYAASMKTAEELNAKAEKQTGMTKSKTLDQMRALKYEQTKLKADADKEAAAYKAWKDANPVPPEKLAADKELAALEQQLQELTPKVAAVLPNE